LAQVRWLILEQTIRDDFLFNGYFLQLGVVFAPEHDDSDDLFRRGVVRYFQPWNLQARKTKPTVRVTGW
jgi:hypothetical protein